MFVDATELASRRTSRISTSGVTPPRQPERRDLQMDEARAALVQALDQAIDRCLAASGTMHHKKTEVQRRLGDLPFKRFSAAGVWAAVQRRYRLTLTQRHEPADADFDAVEVIADALHRLDEGRWDDFDELAQARLAFHANINPVTILPSAYTLVETHAVAAWLGTLSRSTAVVMPDFVRSYWDALLADRDVWPETEWLPDAFIIGKAASFMQAAEMRRWVSASRRRAVVGKRGAGFDLVLETYTPALADRYGLAASCWQESLQR